MSGQMRLTALDRFTCLGGECPDNCCREDWDIVVDSETLREWSTVAPALQHKLRDSIAHVMRGQGEISTMKRRSDGGCVHLDDRNLCGLQRDYGAGVLPAVCREYPRMHAQGHGMHVASASLACPEMARLALFADSGRPLFAVRHRHAPQTELEVIAAHLDRVVTEIFADGDYWPSARLHCLASVLARLALLCDQGALDETSLSKTGQGVGRELRELDRAIKSGGDRPPPVAAGAFWQAVHSFGAARNLFADAGRSSLIALLAEDQGDKERRFRAIAEAIERHRNASRPVLLPYLKVFENYLRIALVNRGFPWNPPYGNHIAAFFSTAVPFAVVQLLLWIKHAEQGALDASDVLYAIYKTERRLGHSSMAYRVLEEHPQWLRLDQYRECLTDTW